MLFRSVILICFISFGLITGCALSPQQLTPALQITKSLPKTAHGQTINVKVIDARGSDIIGTRGGLYASTSNLSVQSSAIVPKLQTQIEQALTNMGYQPQTSGANTTLTVTINKITYSVPDSTYVRTANVEAELHSQIQSTSQTYSGRYSSATSQEFATTPSLETNNQLISKVLSNALTRLLQDPKLANIQ